MWGTESSRKSGRDVENRPARYRNEPIRDKEREFRKDMGAREVTDVRDIRLKKDLREGRDRNVDTKNKEDRYL